MPQKFSFQIGQILLQFERFRQQKTPGSRCLIVNLLSRITQPELLIKYEWQVVRLLSAQGKSQSTACYSWLTHQGNFCKPLPWLRHLMSQITQTLSELAQCLQQENHLMEIWKEHSRNFSSFSFDFFSEDTVVEGNSEFILQSTFSEMLVWIYNALRVFFISTGCQIQESLSFLKKFLPDVRCWSDKKESPDSS